MHRRQFLAGVGVGTIGVVAGCLGETRPETRWHQQALPSSGVRRSPTVVNNMVFAGGGTNSSYVSALDATDGSIEWTYRTGGAVFTSPHAVGGTVFIASEDDNVYALDAATGDEDWRFETNGAGWSSPTATGTTVYVGGIAGTVYALDSESGMERWRVEIGDRIYSSPTVSSNTVFIGSDGGSVYALDTETGDTEWQFETDDPIRSSPTVENDTVFVGNHSGVVYALEAASGEPLWEFNTGFSERFASPTLYDGTLYIGSWYGTIYALDSETSKVVWEFDEIDNRISPATVADDLVVCSGWQDGVAVLFGLEATSGSVEWQIEIPLGSGPTIVDGTIFVGTDGVLALDAGDIGSSVDSRVELGTLGHHHEWANNYDN